MVICIREQKSYCACDSMEKYEHNNRAFLNVNNTDCRLIGKASTTLISLILLH